MKQRAHTLATWLIASAVSAGIGGATAPLALAAAWIARLAVKAELWHWRRRHNQPSAHDNDRPENPKDPDQTE